MCQTVASPFNTKGQAILAIGASVAVAAFAANLPGLTQDGVVTGKVTSKWSGRRFWNEADFANVVQDDGRTTTVSIGDQFNYIHPGFFYEIEVKDGQAIASRRLSD